MAGIIAIVIVVAIGILARLRIPFLSAILRAWWNISFTIAAFIPFCGWMSRFIIATDEEEKKNKEELVGIGEKNDDAAIDGLNEAAQRDLAEAEARRVQQMQAEESRRALEDELNASAYKKYGSRNVTLNSDGTMAKVGDGEYVPVEQLKSNLQ